MPTSKYTKDILEPLCERNTSMMGVVRDLGLKASGGNHSHIKKIVDRLQIDTSHFLGRRANLGKAFSGRRKTPEQILVVRPVGSNREHAKYLRRALVDSGIKELCSECGLSILWNDKPITLHVDHVDGNWLDCRIGNLRFLCPNCHSQTETHGSKIRGV